MKKEKGEKNNKNEFILVISSIEMTIIFLSSREITILITMLGDGLTNEGIRELY